MNNEKERRKADIREYVRGTEGQGEEPIILIEYS